MYLQARPHNAIKIVIATEHYIFKWFLHRVVTISELACACSIEFAHAGLVQVQSCTEGRCTFGRRPSRACEWQSGKQAAPVHPSLQGRPRL